MQLVKMTTKVLGMSATCPTPITILPRRGGSQHGTSLRPTVEAGREAMVLMMQRRGREGRR